MKIVGTVAPAEVPPQEPGPNKGVWTGLAARAVHEHEHERVLVVAVKDQAELKKMRNGIASWLRDRNYRLAPVVVPADPAKKDGELRVFMELHLLTEGRNGQA